ncbi:MAG TPA: uroporphyrinogen-III C-methyltransferase [Phycisphaerae bacterium]|nr:uroporphyrinogen-III C-methyltransferase [Phycisphaerae bacterium]HRW54882.1 uroporphyrinogen-III C-methyltransferase [Phycisphaerae bacterium]
MKSPHDTGRVYLVGAGPGDPELITMRGMRLLQAADVVLFDRLIAMELLAAAGSAELIDVGKAPGNHRMTQSRINELIVSHALAGRTVVRLKGGDPLTFGRGLEEQAACQARGIPCEIVPGVSSVHAAPAAAGVPLTHRGVARSYAVITGQTQDGALPDHDFSALAKIDTLAVLMGLARLREITDGLLRAGRSATTPVAIVASGTTIHQRTITGTLSTIADIAIAEEIESPAVTIIGDVAAFANQRGAVIDTLAESPLRGKRVVVTQARSTSTNLQRRLADAGADVINVPLIDIHYPPPTNDAREAIQQLLDGAFDVIAFTSVHGARGFRQALDALGISPASLPPVVTAALGPGTAEQAVRSGFNVTIIPSRALAEDLVTAIDRSVPITSLNGRRRVLFPKSNRALPTLPAGLSALGFDVVDPVVYTTVDAKADEADLRGLRDGVDAILFCSPSAVQRFVRLDLPLDGVVVGCIGPTTADAARELGLRVDVLPEQPGSPGLVQSLADFYARLEAPPCHR